MGNQIGFNGNIVGKCVTCGKPTRGKCYLRGQPDESFPLCRECNAICELTFQTWFMQDEMK